MIKVSKIMFLTILVSCVLAVQQVSAQAEPAPAGNEIIPLKVGDKIPDALWDESFPVVSAESEQTQQLSLGDFKDKLIILDFWATWCGSCIAAMPKLHDIAEEFKDEVMVIPVTMEGEEKVRPFLNNNEKVKPLGIESIVKGETLKGYFPHRLIPHMVWIGKDGKVLDFTTAEAVNKEAISLALKGNAKKEIGKVDIDTERPLFSIEELPVKSTIMYSVFIKGYQTGLPSGNKYRRKDGQVYGLAIYNRTIPQMYETLYYLAGQRFEKDKILFESSSGKNEQFTFELTLPLADASGLYKRMIGLLDTYSGYQATATADALIIRESNTNQHKP